MLLADNNNNKDETNYTIYIALVLAGLTYYAFKVINK